MKGNGITCKGFQVPLFAVDNIFFSFTGSGSPFSLDCSLAVVAWGGKIEDHFQLA